MVLMRALLRGMGKQADCELILRKEPLAGGPRRYRYTQCAVLHAPFDLPDGEYIATTEDGFTIATTRLHGLWLHGDLQEPAAMESEQTA